MSSTRDLGPERAAWRCLLPGVERKCRIGGPRSVDDPHKRHRQRPNIFRRIGPGSLPDLEVRQLSCRIMVPRATVRRREFIAPSRDARRLDDVTGNVGGRGGFCHRP